MAYILGGDGRNHDFQGAFRRYQDYLQSLKDIFPPSAHALATSGWYYDFSDHRCPHDSWLEAMTFSEPASGSRMEARSLALDIRLLSAYHDGYIELSYPRVFSYSLAVSDGTDGHRDWGYDEFRLSTAGHLIHEIEWHGAAATGTWIIEASDVQFRWSARH